MAIDPLFLAIGWLTTALMAIGKGAFGGGLAILGIPLLSLVVDPLDAAIMVAPLVSLMDIFALGAFGRASWSKPDLVWLLPGLVVGIGIGTAAFVFVDPRIVTMLMALVTLVFAGQWFLRGRYAKPGALPPTPPLALVAGTASGFTTFIAHAGGPPIGMYLLARGLDKTMYAGTSVALFTVGNAIKLVPYGALGLTRPQALWGALALAPAVPIGVWLGKRLHDRLPPQKLFFWCYLLLSLAAVKLLADAVRSLLS
jgi:uncharacterized membrane protein YfcA